MMIDDNKVIDSKTEGKENIGDMKRQEIQESQVDDENINKGVEQKKVVRRKRGK